MSILKNKRILFHISLAAGGAVLDQLSKLAAARFLSGGAESSSLLGFSLTAPVKNYNLALGLQISGDHTLTITILTGGFGLLLFYYGVSLALIPASLNRLQTGISLLFAGFSGNIISRALTGGAMDFIKFRPAGLYFNFADLLQTAGWILILYQIIKLRKTLWRGRERRKILLPLKAEQRRFIGYGLLSLACLSVFFILLSSQFLNFVYHTDWRDFQRLNAAFLKYSFFMLIFMCLFMLAFFVYFSNKIYGPIYAFERHIRGLLSGKKSENLKLRKGDQLKEQLEALAKDIKDKIK